MAKMFYRFDEARQVLGMSDEQLRQLTREGKLREFRDGTQVMYKADQVDQLKSELGLGGENVDIGPSDTGGPIGLMDSRDQSSSGSVISLSDTSSKDDTAADLAMGSGSGTGIALSSTGTGPGIGLAASNTGTGTGMGSTGGSTSGGSTSGGSRGGSSGGSTGGSTGGSMGGSGVNSASGSGVSVLGLDEGGNADANAATAMGGSFGGEPSLEAMGSGSGLLDLSRERDDTSLGAPVLDEITAGSSRSGSGGAISGAPLTATTVTTTSRATGGMPVYVEQSDNFAGFAAGASAAAAVFALLAIYAVAAAAMRTQPTLLAPVMPDKAPVSMLMVLGAGIVAAVIFGVVGFFIGRKR